MTESIFGPEYPKIDTLFKRDDRKVIVPGEWATEEFAYLADCTWRWTEKVDGTNTRVHWNGEKVTIGGRTDDASIPTFLVAALEELRDPNAWVSNFDTDATDVTLYGEAYGPKIQKGGQYRDDVALILFDVRVGQWWLKPEAVADVAKKFGLEVVPDVGLGTLKEAAAWVRYSAEPVILKSHWPNARLEGLVGTPLVSLFDRKGERIIAKIKVKDFEDLQRRGAK